MEFTVDSQAARSLLLQYSEWLDTKRIDLRDKTDPRTHEDLIAQFIASRHVHAIPALQE